MVHMLMGIQGSGKSTLAKKLNEECNLPVVSTDRVRMDFPGVPEKEVWPFVYLTCARYIRNNQDFIFDATNVTPKVRKRFFDEVSKFGVKPIVGIHFLNTDEAECVRRVDARNKMATQPFIPLDVIHNYALTVVPPSLEEGFAFIKIYKNGELTEEIK